MTFVGASSTYSVLKRPRAKRKEGSRLSEIGSFEWDEDKRQRNLHNHKVDFFDIVPLFEGEVLESMDDRFDYGETRIRCLGELGARVYVVVYTWRGENRRIISARKANDREQRAYYARKA